ncbi:MAG: tetratricopeptide repeat protein [Planctomycetota bacterium]|nr:tetratricopeptide repeat protein [Planctomycetota bacterium]
MPDSSRFDELVSEGRKCIRKRRFDLAVQFFAKALEHNNGSPIATEGLAMAYFLDDQLEAALEQFDRMTKLDPRNANGYINKGAVCNRLGEYNDALKALQRGLQFDRKSSQAYYNLGIAHKGLGSLSMAISSYREAIRHDAESREAHQNLANVYLEMGNYQQAISHFKNALMIDPSFERAKRGLLKAETKGASVQAAAAPFGRLVDTKKLDAQTTETLKRLTDTDRFDDRRTVARITKLMMNSSKNLIDHVRNELEPLLLKVNRTVAQSPGDVIRIRDCRDDFRDAVDKLATIRQQLKELGKELTDHEKTLRVPNPRSVTP